MVSRKTRPPVIICGMHRSGTSMIARLLERMGLFVGWRKEANNEALFFLRINDWLLYEAGGAWTYPAPMLDLLQTGDVRSRLGERLRRVLRTPRTLSFLGVAGYLRHRDLFSLKVPWGWKDPRNTFTLPLWLDLYPEAKLIHVSRHGVDVASSLKVRRDRRMSVVDSPSLTQRLLRPHSVRFAKLYNFTRCSTLAGAFSLWEEYMDEAERHVQEVGERALTVRYEDFLATPHEALKTLADFCGLQVSDTAIARSCESVKRSRAFAYQEDEVLCAFAADVEKRLAARGY